MNLAALACSVILVTAPGPTAEKVLTTALATLGSGAGLDAITSIEVAGSGRENLSAEVQGLAPDVPTWRPHEEIVTVDARTMSVAWQRKTPRNDQSLRWRRLIYRPDSTGFVDFVAGSGGLRGTPASEARRRGLAHRVPHLLLIDVARRGRLLGSKEIRIHSRPCDVVTTVLDGDTLMLTFTREPALLRSVEFRRVQPPRGEVLIRWTWEYWRKDPILGYAPRGHRIDVDGQVFQEVTYSRYVSPAPDVEARMRAADAGPGMMAGSLGASPDTGLVATGEVAPGVHIEQVGGFSVMYVEMKDYVIAMEAPEISLGLEAIPPERPAAHPTADFIARLRAQFPNKPVKYVVISHHHGDHMGGIRAFADAGAIVIVPAGDRAFARRALASTDSIETVADRREIADDSHTIQILNVGKNPHTDENLFVWLPNERIGFQGDLFYDDPMGPFPPPGRGRMNRFTAEWLKSHGIEPRALYGVHNDGASGPGRLAQALTLPE